MCSRKLTNPSCEHAYSDAAFINSCTLTAHCVPSSSSFCRYHSSSPVCSITTETKRASPSASWVRSSTGSSGGALVRASSPAAGACGMRARSARNSDRKLLTFCRARVPSAVRWVDWSVVKSVMAACCAQTNNASCVFSPMPRGGLFSTRRRASSSEPLTMSWRNASTSFTSARL